MSTRDGSPYIYLANADGTAATRLTSGDKPAWSRDGRRLAFQRGGGIFVINADGSGERWLGSGWVDPDWLPDGRGFVFNQFTGPPVGESVLGSRMRVFIGSGRSVRQLVRDAVDPAAPDYFDSQVVYARSW